MVLVKTFQKSAEEEYLDGILMLSYYDVFCINSNYSHGSKVFGVYYMLDSIKYY